LQDLSRLVVKALGQQVLQEDNRLYIYTTIWTRDDSVDKVRQDREGFPKCFPKNCAFGRHSIGAVLRCELRFGGLDLCRRATSSRPIFTPRHIWPTRFDVGVQGNDMQRLKYTKIKSVSQSGSDGLQLIGLRWSCYDFHEFCQCASEAFDIKKLQSFHHIGAVSWVCAGDEAFRSVPSSSRECHRPRLEALAWRHPQWIKFHETLRSISTCSWSVGLQRSLHCFKIFKLLVHLRSPEWHSTLPNPAMNCIAWFIVFRSGCISARALQGYLPNAEFVSLTWGSLTHLGCRMSHWRLKTRLCFYWYWAYRFGLLPHMLAILLYNILHNVQR
jgi:hypothetical protein